MRRTAMRTASSLSQLLVSLRRGLPTSKCMDAVARVLGAKASGAVYMHGGGFSTGSGNDLLRTTERTWRIAETWSSSPAIIA